MSAEFTLPQSRDAEAAVLGSVLLNPSEYLDDMLTNVSRPMFFIRAHGIIFEALCEMSKKNIPIDLISLCDQLTKMEKLEEVGGAFTVSGLTANLPTGAHMMFYIEILKENQDAETQSRQGQAAEEAPPAQAVQAQGEAILAKRPIKDRSVALTELPLNRLPPPPPLAAAVPSNP